MHNASHSALRCQHGQSTDTDPEVEASEGLAGLGGDATPEYRLRWRIPVRRGSPGGESIGRIVMIRRMRMTRE